MGAHPEGACVGFRVGERRGDDGGGIQPIWYFPTRTPTRGMGTHAAQKTFASVSEGIASKGTSMPVASSTRSGLLTVPEPRFVFSRKARSSMVPAPSL
jgi:hypothetical protein